MRGGDDMKNDRPRTYFFEIMGSRGDGLPEQTGLAARRQTTERKNKSKWKT
jgi:hypothetical protein